MNRRDLGFTLVELIVVIAVAAILTSIATMQFNDSMVKAGIESEATQVYSELMAARQEAMNMKRLRAVKVKAQKFEIFSTTVTTVAPVRNGDLKYSVLSGSNILPAAGQTITFDERGFVTNVSNISLCVEPSGDTVKLNGARFDSIVVSGTRIRLGKRTVEGASCIDGNIQLK